MIRSAKRTFDFLLHTPLLPPAPQPQAIELATIASAPRLRTRTISSVSIRRFGPIAGEKRGYATGNHREELYGDEAGDTAASTDDISHTDAAFNKDPNPQTSAEKIEKETGEDFTEQSPTNPAESYPPGKQGEKGTETPLKTSKHQPGR
ncbi:hypothetical protein L204_100701 [Cryptococcus depauperatus]|nr:hypothetical protein L204_01367 [Cryptococcus depauperatus CBS 7855]